jgi:hypothetical protein
MRFRAVRFAISVHFPRRAKTRRIASPRFWNCAGGGFGFVLLSPDAAGTSPGFGFFVTLPSPRSQYVIDQAQARCSIFGRLAGGAPGSRCSLAGDGMDMSRQQGRRWLLMAG